METDKLDSIPFLIWDDYYDDGYTPPGEEQSTYGFVEEYDHLSETDKEAISGIVFEFIKTLDMTGVIVEHLGEEVYFTNFSHARRERLVKELQASGLTYQDLPIDFYSES